MYSLGVTLAYKRSLSYSGYQRLSIKCTLFTINWIETDIETRQFLGRLDLDGTCFRVCTPFICVRERVALFVLLMGARNAYQKGVEWCAIAVPIVLSTSPFFF